MKSIFFKSLCCLTIMLGSFVFADNSFANGNGNGTDPGGVDPVHCEVPCGIYDDSIRVALIAEHIGTIEKSMKQIQEISASDDPNYNQLVRWVMNKEAHAEEIQDIVSQYFLHQRIKMVEDNDKKAYKKYLKQLELLHGMLVYSMKCKQTTDVNNTSKLAIMLKKFEDSYFHTHDH